MTDLRYPIGQYDMDVKSSPAQRPEFIRQIGKAPAKIKEAVAGLTNKQLDTPYRPGGWTVTQVVHHLADSHINAYVRTRLIVTEDEPLVKPYNETLWAELIDSRKAPISLSLQLLESMHKRWVILLNSLKPKDFKKMYRHPEYGSRNLDVLIALYAWHGRHHTAHITALRDRMGWK
ncbi:MAG: YfiT family bacillithiol transferase [Bacteroidota bacterium]